MKKILETIRMTIVYMKFMYKHYGSKYLIYFVLDDDEEMEKLKKFYESL